MTSILLGMAGRLQQEIKQTKPFGSLEEEVILNLMRTAEYLGTRGAEVFKRADLTGTQYNALRILRGAGPDGLSCREIGERMVTTVPDVTRLLDRLEARGLISRERPAHNRRQVITRVTEEGLRLLSELDGPVVESHRRLAGHLGERQLKTLNRMLESLRGEQG
jgi:DNA-binding MarR family transcriptional regulator